MRERVAGGGSAALIACSHDTPYPLAIVLERQHGSDGTQDGPWGAGLQRIRSALLLCDGVHGTDNRRGDDNHR